MYTTPQTYTSVAQGRVAVKFNYFLGFSTIFLLLAEAALRSLYERRRDIDGTIFVSRQNNNKSK